MSQIFLTFVLPSLLLLATPGPTNTLLATSGAAAGLRRSLSLLSAEVIGYMVSILLLDLVLGPIVRHSPAISMILKASCGLYLVWLAIKLWREGGATLVSPDPVPWRRVLTTTLLNPKAVIFAFTILPFLKDGDFRHGAPYLVALAAMIVVIGGSWIALGAALRAGSGGKISGVVRRVGAVALATFALVLGNAAVAQARSYMDGNPATPAPPAAHVPPTTP